MSRLRFSAGLRSQAWPEGAQFLNDLYAHLAPYAENRKNPAVHDAVEINVETTSEPNLYKPRITIAPIGIDIASAHSQVAALAQCAPLRIRALAGGLSHASPHPPGLPL